MEPKEVIKLKMLAEAKFIKMFTNIRLWFTYITIASLFILIWFPSVGWKVLLTGILGITLMSIIIKLTPESSSEVIDELIQQKFGTTTEPKETFQQKIDKIQGLKK